MCGICGLLDFKKTGIVSKKNIKKMLSSMTHRGPDDEGVFADSIIGLGHRRLSIIDLSANGHQPMTNEDGDIQIVFNGEIYNFLELRNELKKKGHKFTSTSDTEAIIHAYEEWGEKSFSRFNGIFAFAIWDSKKKKLILARDHMGVKPLYYSLQKDSIAFASEIKAFTVLDDFKLTVDKTAVDIYFTMQYIPAPRTIYNEIKKLTPGHYLISERGKITINKFWDVSFKNNPETSEQAVAKKLRQMIEDSVKLQLVSDVPLGVFLSGGLDSTIITSAAAKFKKDINSFSVGFDSEERFNELKYARIASEHIGTTHHEMIVTSKDLRKELPGIIHQLDEPFSDFAAIPTYMVSRFARKKITVALSGEGADELFAGYPKYRYAKIPALYRKIPNIIRPNTILNASAKLLDSRKIMKLAKIMSLEDDESHHIWDSVFEANEKDALYTEKIKHDESQIQKIFNEQYKNANTKDSLNKMFYADLKVWLAEDLLMKVDKTSMLASLEARVPYLDPSIVNYAANIPSSMKIKGKESKHILKKAFADTIPKEILNREKHGFNLPISPWFKKELKDMPEILLEKQSIQRGYFKEAEIRKIIEDHRLGRKENSSKIWTLLNFELWNRTYIDKEVIKL